MTDETTHIARAAALLDDPYAALSQHLHGDGDAPWSASTCDMPDCTGPRQILLMEPAMRCICRRCWRMMGDNA